MNRIERRIAGTNGSRPGAPVCNPGTPQNNVAMLGGIANIYPSQQRQTSNVRQVNGLAMLQMQGDRINNLEQKLLHLEQLNVMNISRTDAELRKKDKTIDLMNKDFRTTMKELRTHIKELQTKIKHLNGDIPIVNAVKQEIETQEANKPPLPAPIEQENITLEINET